MVALQQQSLRLNDQQDSTLVIGQLEIWPKGVFRFSAENGFEGEAERVVWQGKTSTMASQQEKLWHAAVAEQSTVLDLNLVEQAKVDQQMKVSRISWKRVLILFCIIVIGVFVVVIGHKR